MAITPVAIKFGDVLRKIPLRDLDQTDPRGGVSGYQARRLPKCATPFCKSLHFFVSLPTSMKNLPP
jgi:hypothetical protein